MSSKIFCLLPILAACLWQSCYGATIDSAKFRAVDHPVPRQLAPRGAGAAEFLDALFLGVVSGISQSAAKNLQQAFGATSPTCCDNASSSCRLNAGTSDAGHKWMACYDEGTEEIYDFDVAAMKCIIDLHYRQADVCISIAGSVCANGYGGGLLRGQMGWWGGNSNADLISDQDSKTFQAAADSMKGVKIDYSNPVNAAIQVVVVSDTNGLLSSTVEFDGHQGRDC